MRENSHDTDCARATSQTFSLATPASFGDANSVLGVGVTGLAGHGLPRSGNMPKCHHPTQPARHPTRLCLRQERLHVITNVTRSDIPPALQGVSSWSAARGDVLVEAVDCVPLLTTKEFDCDAPPLPVIIIGEARALARLASRGHRRRVCENEKVHNSGQVHNPGRVCRRASQQAGEH